MQNILVNKETGIVETIMEWSDNTKVEKEDYPNNLVMYISDKENYLDPSKDYKFVNGAFEVEMNIANLKLSPTEILTQQIAKLAIENKKKDVMANTMAKTIADLNIRINKLEKEGK